ncbi:MAG: hypothetical protein O2856_05730 [Planctomycetota bacterium]|nr:hypothetical protein [Planctomycetota bacterium]
MLNGSRIHESQISELERLRGRCINARNTVNSVRRQLTELRENEMEMAGSIRHRHESAVHTQQERVAQEAGDRLAELQRDSASACDAINRSHEYKLKDPEAVHKESRLQ